MRSLATSAGLEPVLSWNVHASLVYLARSPSFCSASAAANVHPGLLLTDESVNFEGFQLQQLDAVRLHILVVDQYKIGPQTRPLPCPQVPRVPE